MSELWKRGEEDEGFYFKNKTRRWAVKIFTGKSIIFLFLDTYLRPYYEHNSAP